MNYQSILLSSIIAGSLLSAGCEEAHESPAPPQTVAVSAIQAAYRQIPANVTLPGIIQARSRISLSSQINGFVREVRVRAGDTVRPGQLLVTLDAREAKSQKAAAQAAIEEANAALDEARQSVRMAESVLAAAKANSDLAETTFQRYRKLFEAKSASPQELDEVRARRDAAAADFAAKETMIGAAQNRIRQSEARISRAKAQEGGADVLLGWTVVKSPASARIVERQVDPGSAIFPGSPLLVLETLAGKQAVASIPSSQSQYLAIGLEVRVIDEAEGISGVAGRVTEIVPLSDPGNHTIQFKVDLGSDYSPPAGRFVRVLVPMNSRTALLVPRDTLRRKGQLTGIFVIDSSSVARFRLVKTADFSEDQLEILSGIEPGENIVASPGPDIVDGVPLEVRS